MSTYKAIDLEALPQIAQQIIALMGNKKIITFYGEMGAGKTTLIRQIGKQMGVLDTIQSPTFSIVNQYKTISNKTIYHFDFYRINDENEALDFGVEEYFYSNDFCFIEWAEKIPNLLPENYLKITIEVQENNKRLITISD